MRPHWLAMLLAGKLHSVPNSAYCVAVKSLLVSDDIHAMNDVPAMPLATLSRLMPQDSHASGGGRPPVVARWPYKRFAAESRTRPNSIARYAPVRLTSQPASGAPAGVRITPYTLLRSGIWSSV